VASVLRRMPFLMQPIVIGYWPLPLVQALEIPIPERFSIPGFRD